MNLASAVLSGLGIGVVLSIPPGPAGLVILQRSLSGERAQAARAVGAYLAAELTALFATLACLQEITWLAARPLMKAAAGCYLLGFAVRTLWAARRAEGPGDTSALGVFRLTILNPAIWAGAVSTLTIARATGGAGLLPAVLFVSAFELGCVGWYLAVIFGARAIPAAYRRHVEQAAVLVIAGTGVWCIASAL